MLEVRPFDGSDSAAWDEFCASSMNATLLHTRRFLSYHGDRFQDASVTIHANGELVGVLAAARARHDAALVVSHPGATFGGLVHQGKVLGSRMLDAFEALKVHYRAQGFHRMQYKPVPHIYPEVPSQDDLYALFRHRARRIRCDLSCTIDLARRRAVSERRRRGLKKAARVVRIESDMGLLPQLWDVLTDNLARKHDAAPVHTLAEISELVARFPADICLRGATVAGKLEAGVLFFRSCRVWHAQYIAASEIANEASALDAVFEHAIQEGTAEGARYFDFGTSNEQAGLVLNDGLYRFKSEFGGGGVAYEQYELDLEHG